MHRFYIEEKIGVSIIDSIPHCHTENAPQKGTKARNVASFLYSGKMEYLSSIVFHTVILKCFQTRQNQEMWLRCYIEDKVGVCIIDTIPH